MRVYYVLDILLPLRDVGLCHANASVEPYPQNASPAVIGNLTRQSSSSKSHCRRKEYATQLLLAYAIDSHMLSTTSMCGNANDVQGSL